MKRKAIDATSVLTLSWCAAVMIVWGWMLPPMIEAPYPPRIILQKKKRAK